MRDVVLQLDAVMATISRPLATGSKPRPFRAKVTNDQTLVSSVDGLSSRLFALSAQPLSPYDAITESRGLDMRRRDFVVGAVSFAAATRAAAQPVTNSRRLAIVSALNAHAQMQEDSGNYISVFLAELRRLGQIEGQNLTIERYGKEQYQSDSAALAAQIVRSNPDVISPSLPALFLFSAKPRRSRLSR
jgi:hypothetical protein